MKRTFLSARRRAIARQPKVLLFDEPLARLEPAERTELRAEIRKPHERLATTMMYAPRDPSEAMALAQSVAVLRAVKVAQPDRPAAAYRRTANAHEAGKEIKLENAAAGSPVPLHPGAIRYYKEKGLIK